MPAFTTQHTSPISPTRITVPATDDDRGPCAVPWYSSSQSHLEGIESTFFEDSVAPPQDDNALDELWWTLRRKKAQKMARERCKVKSLEEPSPEVAQIDLPANDEPVNNIPETNTPETKPVKRQKSV